MSDLRVNPFYLYSCADTATIFEGVIPLKTRKDNNIYFIQETVAYDRGAEDLRAQLKEYTCINNLMPENTTKGKLLCLLSIRSTIRARHYIQPNGEMTFDLSNAKSHSLREYFDGSVLDDLGHAIIACIDFDLEKVTLQDSKGVPFDSRAQKVIQDFVPNFTVEDLCIHQQKDGHNCAVISVANCIDLVLERPLDENIDPLRLRQEFTQYLPYCSSEAIVEGHAIYQRPFIDEPELVANF